MYFESCDLHDMVRLLQALSESAKWGYLQREAEQERREGRLRFNSKHYMH